MQNNLQYVLPGHIVQICLLSERLKNTIDVKLVYTSERLTFEGTEQEITSCIPMKVLPPFPLPYTPFPRTFHISCMLPFSNSYSFLAFDPFNRSCKLRWFAMAMWCMQKRKNRIRALCLCFLVSQGKIWTQVCKEEKTLYFSWYNSQYVSEIVMA